MLEAPAAHTSSEASKCSSKLGSSGAVDTATARGMRDDPDDANDMPCPTRCKGTSRWHVDGGGPAANAVLMSRQRRHCLASSVPERQNDAPSTIDECPPCPWSSKAQGLNMPLPPPSPEMKNERTPKCKRDLHYTHYPQKPARMALASYLGEGRTLPPARSMSARPMRSKPPSP